MPAQVDDFNYDIWLEHSGAKVGYRLARDEDGNVQISTGSAPVTAQKIYSGDFSLESVNNNVDVPVAFEKYHHGAGFSDYTTPFGYRYSEGIDASWPHKLYLSPLQSSSSSTTQTPLKIVKSVYGLFIMTARYVLEWTGAAWTSRLDTGGTNTNTDLIEFSNLTGTYLVLGVSNGNYYTSSDGITWTTVGTAPTSGPAFRADAEDSGTGTSSTVTKPTGTADNDILIAIASNRVASDMTAPAGWTALVGQKSVSSNIHSTTVWWKRASSEGADYTFTWATSGLYRITISAFSGCITTGSPFEDTDYTTNASPTTTHTLPAMTSAGANRLAVGMISAMDDANSSISFTVASGYTETQDAAGVIGHEGSYIAVAAAGAVASAAATSSTAGYGMSFHALLIPSVSGGGSATFLDISRFAIRGQSNGDPLLWAIDSTGDIRNTADPTDGSAWSAADTIRMGVGSTIIGLEVVDNVFYLIHSKGITSYDGTSVSNVWNNTTLQLASNDARPFVWVDKGIYFTFSGSLYRYTADSNVIEKIWPKGSQGSTKDLTGIIVAITGSEQNLYFLLENAYGVMYIMKCDPYQTVTVDEQSLMPVHSIVYIANSGTRAMASVGAGSDTFSSTQPQLVFGYGTNSRYVLLPTPGRRPEDDSAYRFDTGGGQLYTSWIHSGARTFNKFLNTVAILLEDAAAAKTATLKYNTADDGSSFTSIGTYTSVGLNTTGLSSDVEYQRISIQIGLTTNDNTSSPIVSGTILHTSLNPTRVRQWELQIEISDNQEMLGGGDSNYGARYLATHLFNGLTERVTFHDRLGNSFICKILDVTSVSVGEDKEVYSVPLVQLV